MAVAFCFVPFMAVANSYGAGLTDQDNSSMYGKLCIFIFAAWAGTSGQGAIAGLGICGVVLSATSQAASLMQVPYLSPCRMRGTHSRMRHFRHPAVHVLLVMRMHCCKHSWLPCAWFRGLPVQPRERPPPLSACLCKRSGCNARVMLRAQDFRTGYYTLASPKALFTVQVCGAFLGVLYSPAVYTFYNHAFKSAPFGGAAVI